MLLVTKKVDEGLVRLGERAADVCVKLIEKLRADGHKVDATGANLFGVRFETIHKVDGAYPEFRIDAQRTGGGGYRTRANDKLYITMGPYGETRNYPEPKKGFDIDKTAERLMSIVNGQIKKEKENDERKAGVEKAKGVAFEVQQALERHLAPGTARVSAVVEGRKFGGDYIPERARKVPLVSIEMTPEEAEAVAMVLASMRSKAKD